MRGAGCGKARPCPPGTAGRAALQAWIRGADRDWRDDPGGPGGAALTPPRLAVDRPQGLLPPLPGDEAHEALEAEPLQQQDQEAVPALAGEEREAPAQLPGLLREQPLALLRVRSPRVRADLGGGAGNQAARRAWSPAPRLGRHSGSSPRSRRACCASRSQGEGNSQGRAPRQLPLTLCIPLQAYPISSLVNSLSSNVLPDIPAPALLR